MGGKVLEAELTAVREWAKWWWARGSKKATGEGKKEVGPTFIVIIFKNGRAGVGRSLTPATMQ